MMIAKTHEWRRTDDSRQAWWNQKCFMSACCPHFNWVYVDMNWLRMFQSVPLGEDLWLKAPSEIGVAGTKHQCNCGENSGMLKLYPHLLFTAQQAFRDVPRSHLTDTARPTRSCTIVHTCRKWQTAWLQRRHVTCCTPTQTSCSGDFIHPLMQLFPTLWWRQWLIPRNPPTG